MAFDRESSVIPTSIGDMAIELFDPAPGSEEPQKATVHVQVRLSNGTVVVRRFNLADHVSATIINQLNSLAATLRTKANTEILPP